MKKLISIGCLVGLLITSFFIMSYSSKTTLEYIPITGEILAPLYGDGSPGGVTGSPGDSGNTCTGCHGAGTSFSLVPSITTDIPGTGYVLGQTYAITVSTTSSGADAWGFELTAEKTDNSKIGAFNIAGSVGEPMLLTSTSVTQSGKDFSEWIFNWIAPATDEGQITFYAAVLAGNGQGSNNDQTVTVSEVVNKSTLGVQDENILAFNMYPNPSENILTIQLPNDIQNSTLNVYDYLGRNVKSTEISRIENKIDLSQLTHGVYFIKLYNEGKTGIQTFIKK